MKHIEPKLAKLKNHLETAAFMVSKWALEKEAHSAIVQSLIIVSEIEGMFTMPKKQETDEKIDIDEVNKVNRRLKLWARKPNQINSKILNAFLRLERSGITKITETDLRNELSKEKSFESNFSQMKIIAKKNHGKVFEQYGESISLWNPIVAGIREYEKIVFEKN